MEVGNTDAEGRLILCDALALADEEKPDLLIDLATLTGAARVALGPELPALFTADDALARRAACDIAAQRPIRMWRMPLWQGYDDELSSKIADLNNVSTRDFPARSSRRCSCGGSSAMRVPGCTSISMLGTARSGRAGRSARNRRRSARYMPS